MHGVLVGLKVFKDFFNFVLCQKDFFNFVLCQMEMSCASFYSNFTKILPDIFGTVDRLIDSILCSQCYLLLSKLLQGQVLGDLTKKNCTTMFHSLPKDYDDIYFFRLECTERLKFTFQKGVYITQQGMNG